MADASQYKSRSVEVTLKIGDAYVPVSGLTLRHTIDELPYAEISLQMDNLDINQGEIAGSVAIDVAKFRQLALLFQEKILNEFRVDPNVRLVVKDENNDGAFTLTFNGFLGKPEISIQEGIVSIKVGMVHAAAALQAWNGQIYNYIEPYVIGKEAAFDSSSSPDAQAAGKGSSVSMKVLALVEYMMRAVEMVPNTDDEEFDMMPIHLLNQKALKIVSRVLKASEATTEIDGLGDADFNSDNLYEVLFEMIRNSPNFWTVLQQLGQTFLLQTNADWAGNLWLEPIQSVSDGTEGRRISVPLAQVRFNVAHLFELPIQQVIVVGEGQDLYVFSGTMGLNQGAAPLAPIPMPGGQYYTGRIPQDGEVWTKMQGLARYPVNSDRTLVGNFYVLQAPFWINSDTVLDTQLKQLQSGLQMTDDRWTQIIAAQPDLQNTLLKASKPRRKLLSYMAEQLFNSLYLGSTYASITVPFDLRPCVGRRYKVEDLSGEAMFDGFLKEVVHNVVLAADGASSASTDLIFTHVVVTGAKLKQLEQIATPGAVEIPVDRVDPTFRTPDSVPPTTLAEQEQTAIA